MTNQPNEKDLLMKFPVLLAAATAVAMFSAVSGWSQNSTSRQGSSAGTDDNAKRVRITYENLTSSQVFSPSVFITHNASAPPLFKEGEQASFGLMRIAEEGNAGPLLSAEVVKKIGGPFGTAVTAISTLPGQSRSVEVEVTRGHPMLSGAFMLVMTNDGFTGINAVNAYELDRPRTMDLMAYDAGTENNNEKKDYLIAMMGTGRDPENGVVAKHKGIRGDADAPADWKFDPEKPVARLTLTPIRASSTTGDAPRR
jgi:hypothetical protein